MIVCREGNQHTGGRDEWAAGRSMLFVACGGQHLAGMWQKFPIVDGKHGFLFVDYECARVELGFARSEFVEFIHLNGLIKRFELR